MNAEYFNRIVATYGLGVDEFLDLFARQNHSCAICKRGLTLFAEDRAECPVVDHDHSTGNVRGILCTGCNTTLGFIEKDPRRTFKAISYLSNRNRWKNHTKPTDGVRKFPYRLMYAAADKLKNMLDGEPEG